MRILDLRIENIGKIKLFEVHTNGGDVIIGGRNGQGKSTVLTAVEMLLEGKKAFPEKPVRNGAEKGRIVAELEGGFIVERDVKADGRTELVVKNKEGAKYGSPQTLLDGFRGSNTLDPLRFVSLSDKEQLEQLRRLVGLDFSEIDAKRQTLYDQRSEVNRKAKDVASQLLTITFDPSAPAEEISSQALATQLDAINDQIYEWDKRFAEFQLLKDGVKDEEEKIADLEKALLNAQSVVKALKKEIPLQEAWLQNTKRPNRELLETQISEAHKTNDKVRANKEAVQKSCAHDALEKKSKELSASIEELDSEKQKLLSEAKFPVAGLSFAASGVTFKDIPFSQASQAEKLRVSTGMAFAANPKIKVVLIRDGSLLDEENLKLVCEVAREYGGHVWLERVGRGEECSVILEDGEVKENRMTKEKANDGETDIARPGI